MQLKNKYITIGLMSGTSLDGLDIVFCSFILDKGNWNFKILNSKTVSYPDSFLDSLKNAPDFSGLVLAQLDVDLGRFFGQAVNAFLEEFTISETIDFIASHGQTIFHDPKNGLTTQIGCPQTLAVITGSKVIADFRTLDVTLGGQGAPLVPIGDQLLFYEYEACLNLGGFANVSMVDKGERIAWDVCPVNFVMNHYAEKKGIPYDKDGELAASGVINTDLLSQLNDLNYYKSKHPKSLGREWVEEQVLPLIDSFELTIEDILATFLEHTAFQISRDLESIKGNILVTGGGTFNSLLFARMQELCSGNLIKPSSEIIDYKEALIFAFLGVLKSRNENNTLASVTGASKDSCGGVVFNA